MYARQPPAGGFPRPIQLPSNYRGTAFSEEAPASPPPPEPKEAPVTKESDGAAPALSGGRLFSAPGFRLDLGRLFRRDGGGGIGMEELLLIGLILLLSQSETRDDLILLLLVLLFVQ